jgi:hypothetical protein
MNHLPTQLSKELYKYEKRHRKHYHIKEHSILWWLWNMVALVLLLAGASRL